MADNSSSSSSSDNGNVVVVSGMFGTGKTYFINSPVVIDIDGLSWPEDSPFKIARVEVVYDNKVIGDFRADTGGQTSISFDISSALRAIWSDYEYGKEVAAATNAAESTQNTSFIPAQDDDISAGGVRTYREYILRIYTEYLSRDDGGIYTTTQCEDEDGNTDIPGGQCAIGGFTEWERSTVSDKADADVSYREHENQRNGDASTKPTNSSERVGRDSITSWVDVKEEGTEQVYYTKSAAGGTGTADATTTHAPLVLRDSIPYKDFLFVNRRGAIETCSAQMLEAMDIDVETETYARSERPTFQPSRSLAAISKGGRRSWSMSSGYVNREWAEWWTLEFLMAKRWWMIREYTVSGVAHKKYVPVIVAPAKKNTSIYDRTKQQMPHVDFTVTLALEG